MRQALVSLDPISKWNKRINEETKKEMNRQQLWASTVAFIYDQGSHKRQQLNRTNTASHRKMDENLVFPGFMMEICRSSVDPSLHTTAETHL